MKKIFALILVALVVIPACKENKPSITFGESGTKVLSDTTYFLKQKQKYLKQIIEVYLWKILPG